MSYTYAKIEVSESTYHEIKEKLESAGYSHVFINNPDASALPIINMNGFALTHEIEMTPETDAAY